MNPYFSNQSQVYYNYLKTFLNKTPTSSTRFNNILIRYNVVILKFHHLLEANNIKNILTLDNNLQELDWSILPKTFNIIQKNIHKCKVPLKIKWLIQSMSFLGFIKLMEMCNKRNLRLVLVDDLRKLYQYDIGEFDDGSGVTKLDFSILGINFVTCYSRKTYSDLISMGVDETYLKYLNC